MEPVASSAAIGGLETLADADGEPGSIPAPQARVGRYVILRELGRGSTGVVLAAYDLELDRRVALKLLMHGGGEGSPLHERLRLEARALARVNHPNIVAVYDVGAFAGQVFVAMELVAGRPLDQWFAAVRPGWREVLAVFLQAGAGLAAAHAAGLVHRDFKPANAILGEDGRVRVVDFGLARRELVAGPGELAGGGEGSLATLTGSVIGTPAYMAPEQHAGAQADARSDIFAFCVALYEGLHGARPFTGATLGELAAAIVGGKVDPPPRGSTVPTWLRAAVLRGLRALPRDRWPTMAALLQALGRDPDRRRRRIAMVGAQLGLAAAGVTGGLWWHATREPPCMDGAALIGRAWDAARGTGITRALVATGLPYAGATAAKVRALLDEYAGAWTTAHADACAATVVRGTQSQELLDLRMGCLDERRQALAAAVELLAAADARTAERAVALASNLPVIDACGEVASLLSRVRPPTDPEVAAAVVDQERVLARATALLQTAHYDEVEAALQAGKAAGERLGHAALQARWWALEGTLRERRGDYREAEAALSGAYFLARTARADDDASAAASSLVQVVGARLGRLEEAALWYRHALAELGPDADARRRAGPPNAWGGALIGGGKFAEALAPLRESLALRTAAYGEDHLELTSPLNNLGVAHFRLGQLAEAETYYARALQIRERQLGPEHPDVARVLGNLASVRIERGEAALGEAIERRALAIRERSLGDASPEVAASLGNLGLLAMGRGDFVGAEALHRRALGIYRASYGDEHAKVAEALINLGATLAAARRTREAEATIAEAIALWTRRLGAAHPQVASARADHAALLWRLGERAAAEAEARAALADLEAGLGLEHADLAYPLLVLARAALAAGRGEEARGFAEWALRLREFEGVPGKLALAQSVAAQVLRSFDPARARGLVAQAHANIASDPGAAAEMAELDAAFAQ